MQIVPSLPHSLCQVELAGATDSALHLVIGLKTGVMMRAQVRKGHPLFERCVTDVLKDGALAFNIDWFQQ